MVENCSHSHTRTRDTEIAVSYYKHLYINTFIWKYNNLQFQWCRYELNFTLHGDHLHLKILIYLLRSITDTVYSCMHLIYYLKIRNTENICQWVWKMIVTSPIWLNSTVLHYHHWKFIWNVSTALLLWM